MGRRATKGCGLGVRLGRGLGRGLSPPGRKQARYQLARPNGPLRAAVLATALSVTLVGTVAGAASASAFPRLHRHHHTSTVPVSTTTVPSATTTVPSATTTVLTALPAPAAAPAAPADTCFKASWDPAVQGTPASFTTGVDGAYLWYDADGGWALRFTHASSQDNVIFAGSLSTASGQFIDVSPMSDQGTDIVALSLNKRTIYFRFVDFGVLDGLNFGTHCVRAFTVNIHAAGVLVPTSEVHLGASAAAPPGSPFRVTRGALLTAHAMAPATK